MLLRIKLKKWAFSYRMKKLLEAFTAFKQLTDRKKEVTDEDLFTILTDIQTAVVDVKKYEFVAFQVQYGSANLPTATVALNTPRRNSGRNSPYRFR